MALCAKCGKKEPVMLCVCRDCLDRYEACMQPPMVHGQWMKVETEYLNSDLLKECSLCGCVTIKPHGNYCPNCGVKMDGGSKQADEP